MAEEGRSLGKDEMRIMMMFLLGTLEALMDTYRYTIHVYTPSPTNTHSDFSYAFEIL